MNRKRRAGLIALGLCGAVGLTVSTSPAARAQEDAELKRLVEQIVGGDESEAREAADQLIEQIVGPVADALGAVESRPADEQLRIRAVLARLSAALRLRLFRAELPPDDRRLHDAFAAQYSDLVEQTFHDDYRKRLAAVRRIPLEPNTGAGLLIVAKVNDSDGDVAAAALEAAATLKDPVVVRGLTRYIRDATAALRSGFYGPGEEEAALVVGVFVDRSIRILGEAGARESLSAILAALDFFGKTYPADFFDVAAVAKALAKIGDEQAAPALLELLDRQKPYRFHHAGPGQPAVQNIGDVALLSLARLYGIEPQALGFFVAEPPSKFAGFLDDQTRQAAHRAFRQWYEQNANKPRAERKPLTTQPADKK